MSNRLSDKCLINVSLMFWFDSVGKIKSANQTKRWVKKWSEYIQTKCDFLRFRFWLVRFAIFLLDWFNFEKPYFWFVSNLISLWNTTWNCCFHNLCRECADVVQSYLEFKDLLNKYVTLNAAPVSFNVSHSLDRVDYEKIVYDLRLSNLRSGRRDKIKNPRPDQCEYPIVCSL